VEARSVREGNGGFLPKAATLLIRSASSCCLKFGHVTFASRKKCLGPNDGPVNAIVVQTEHLKL
jgi:hypothetical protein